jgi:dihydroorotase
MVHSLVVAGRIVNPKPKGEGIHEGEIGIDDGVITEIKKQGLSGEERIEARGCFIFPGFIDMHVHLREDSSHKWDYKEDFRSGTMAALHGGITTVVDMPNTPLPGIDARRIKEKKELAKKAGLIDVFFCGGVTSSSISSASDSSPIVEMQKEVIAYKIYLSETTGAGGLYMPVEMLPKAFNLTKPKPVVIHCEETEYELSSIKRTLSGVDFVKPSCSINIAHVSVYTAVDIIKDYQYQYRNSIFCEVTPHHLFFEDEEVNARKALLKMNPGLRSRKNRQLLLARFKAEKIDFLASDHAPHTKEEKERSIEEAPAGVPHLDTYGNFVSWLIIEHNIDPEQIARVCSYNPAMFLGLRDRGEIKEGKIANLTILDLKHRTKIRKEHLYTKCGWSPFEGYEFPGAVKHSIFKGEVMSEYDEILVK